MTVPNFPIGNVPRATAPEFEKLKMEYEQVNENFRMLADIRFKLLALVPPLGGVAIFVLSKMAGPDPVPGSQFALVCLVATMGFLATLGVTFYDQRNSEIYNALGGRANFLEHAAKLEKNPDLFSPRHGGQFLEKPEPDRYLFGLYALLMKHDRGLALIYGPVLGAWFFPIVYSFLGGLSAFGLLRSMDPFRSRLAIGVAAIMVIVFVLELLRLDDTFSESRTGVVESYDGGTGKLFLKYTIRNTEKELVGELDQKRRMELLIPKGARIRVWYKSHLFTKPKPQNSKKIFKVEPEEAQK